MKSRPLRSNVIRLPAFSVHRLLYQFQLNLQENMTARLNSFPMMQQSPSGPGSPHYRDFTITLRHTTLGKTLLDEWSAQRRDIYLKTH